MWWFDKKAVAVTEKLRDTFGIVDFIETGTFRGINLKFWSYRFDFVMGAEKNSEYAEITYQRMVRTRQQNWSIYLEASPRFLDWFSKKQSERLGISPPIFYLDAHFYDATLPTDRRWVVKDELKALAGFGNCIIAIHDFDCNGLGHLVYDGHPLNFDLVKDDLLRVNPDFHFYGNTREGCEVHTVESILEVEGLDPDEETLETIHFHNCDRLKYRGILYATPQPLDLSIFPLKEIQ